MNKLLDLFCGAGGAAMGYFHAGFTDITGIDNRPQPRYPFRFIQADALEYLHEHGHEYDFIHASPPCQAYSLASKSQRNAGTIFPDLLNTTRELLNKLECPWVIENVPGAPMRPDFVLCGSQFGMRLIRHRWFELNSPTLNLLSSCAHDPEAITVVGHGTPSWVRKKLGRNICVQEKRDVMGIHWMNRNELSQAIPPAYTEFIGRQLLQSNKLELIQER